MNVLRGLVVVVVGWLAGLAGFARAADVALRVVPAEHPLLYLRAADVAKLAQRMAHPVLAPVMTR